MLTIDHFFTNFIASGEPSPESLVTTRDFKVLTSLHSSLKQGNFLTANQGDLLVRILTENKEKILTHYKNLEEVLELGLWSKPFRIIEVVRKIYLSSNAEKDAKIIVEFTFSSSIRKIMQEITKKITGLEPVTNGKLYIADLDEKNIVLLVESLKPYKFSVDEKLIEYYNTIKSWKKEEIFSQYNISSIDNKNFQNAITEDLGLETPLSQAIVNDRRIR